MVVIPPDHLALASPEEQHRYRMYLIGEAKKQDEPLTWLLAIAPEHCTRGFADHHEEFWQWVWSIERGTRPPPYVAIWPRGGAKALALDEVVPTPGGWQRVGDLAVGDVVLDERGTPTGITAMSPIERKSLYRVTTKMGATVDVSGDHLWTVLDTRTRRLMRPAGHVPEDWATNGDLSVRCGVEGCERMASRSTGHGPRCRSHARRGDGHSVRGLSGRESPVMAARTVTTEEMLAEGLMDGAEWRFAIPTAGEWELPEVDLPLDPWLFGLWLGDGHTAGGRVTVGHEDAREITAAVEMAGFEVRYTDHPNARDLRPVGLTAILEGMGVRGNKHVPESYMRSSAKQRRALLSGLLDSDGSVHRDAVAFANTNRLLADAVRELAVSLGYRASMSEGVARLDGRDCGPVWRVRIAAPPRDVFRLTRKVEGGTGRPMSLNGSLHYIVSIERLPDAEVRCLMVESPSHLFLAGRDAIPTHNSTSAELATVTLGARQVRRYGLYISETQEQADDHVANIAALLESDNIEYAYPELGERMMGKFGSAKGWRRNRIRTSSGLTVDAIGLDSAARGIKLEAQRPDFMVFDDIDGELDSPHITEKKIKTITRKLIPAGSQDCAVLAIQNKVHDDSIFARLSDGRADFLNDRIVSGPIPAVWDMAYEEREGHYFITGGHASWPDGMTVDASQGLLNEIGLTAFLAECQHSTVSAKGGLFDHLNWAGMSVTEAELPRLRRVVVWLDPAVTSTDNSDCQGIQCDALGTDGLIYRLFSWEGRTTPLEAVKRAIRKAIEWNAESVGVETDQGGDTWESVYTQACEELRREGELLGSAPKFNSAKAGQGHGGKMQRAQRMLVDYERHRIRHLKGTSSMLESALERFPKVKPFDLTDAAYWSWADLAEKLRRKPTKYRSAVGLSVGVGTPSLN